MGKITNFW